MDVTHSDRVNFQYRYQYKLSTDNVYNMYSIFKLINVYAFVFVPNTGVYI